MVLFTVRTFDNRRSPPKPEDYERAWYRLVNEDTNQAVDYSKIKTIEKPDGFEEDVPIDEENPDAKRNEIIYVSGRIFLEDSGRWVYESFNHCYTTERYPDLH
jgi:hypothetical protein